MSREVSTTEALMTDPTAPEGTAYWQERHDYEERLELTIGCDCAGEAKWWLGEHRPAKQGLDGRPACPAWTP